MEELQDAIEDAQYVNAIATQDDGPRPVLPWDKPTEEQLEAWKRKRLARSSANNNCTAFSLDWTLDQEIGLFLFSAYIKEVMEDYCRINFCEEVYRFKKLQGRQRVEKAKRIVQDFISEPIKDPETETIAKPDKSEIVECDLRRKKPEAPLFPSEKDLAAALEEQYDYPTCSESVVGLKGIVKEDVLRRVDELEEIFKILSTRNSTAIREQRQDVAALAAVTTVMESSIANLEDAHLDEDLTESSVGSNKEIFDVAECLVLESLRKDYWSGFLESEQYKKLLDFLWYQDRRVVPDDFFVMRVLGRGGFGLVTACKKGTSGKLYAMKVMNKRRIKLKKSEPFAINERQALAAVESKFVVNLKYSFHSKDDVYLILDLMTGGDLGFHLHQKGKFPKKECLYYAARIMLALQAMHDQQYVYRDLKPENCLLADDGRVKITDLGLATKITPTLHGAAGTRGYWAPEMLRRDSRGKRMVYGHTVDWFSFGCCLAEFISGTNPFRSEIALNFGLDRGKQTKEKAIDCATMEMEPEFPAEKFEPEAADLCRKLLDKNEKRRLGYNGSHEIMAHPWFKSVNWESIISDRKRPPFVPAKDVNAASQSEIGTFAEDKTYQETVITERDDEIYKNWDWTNPRAFAAEVIEFLIYERETGEPLVPLIQQNSCCCVTL